MKRMPDVDINNKRELTNKLGDRISLHVNTTAIGDSISATPVVREIKKQYKNNGIDIYTNYPDLFIYNPHIERVYKYDDEIYKRNIYKILRDFGYKKSFIFFPDVSKQNKHPYMNLVDFMAERPLGRKLKDEDKWLEINVTQKEKESLLKKISKHEIDFKNTVIIHPSITWKSRTMPFETWDKLTELLNNNGYQVVAIGESKANVLPGLEKDSPECSMQACPPGAINLMDSLTILESLQLMSLSNTLITLDTGALHLGLSTNINVVGIYTVIHPKYRMAWRKGSYDYKFIAVKPRGNCYFCTNNRIELLGKDIYNCPLNEYPDCLPEAEEIYIAFKKLQEGKGKQYNKDSFKSDDENRTINVTNLCDEVISWKKNLLNRYDSLKIPVELHEYNERVNALIYAVKYFEAYFRNQSVQNNRPGKQDH